MTCPELPVQLRRWLAALRGMAVAGFARHESLDTYLLRDVGLQGCVHAPENRFNPWRDLR